MPNYYEKSKARSKSRHREDTNNANSHLSRFFNHKTDQDKQRDKRSLSANSRQPQYQNVNLEKYDISSDFSRFDTNPNLDNINIKTLKPDKTDLNNLNFVNNIQQTTSSNHANSARDHEDREVTSPLPKKQKTSSIIATTRTNTLFDISYENSNHRQQKTHQLPSYKSKQIVLLSNTETNHTQNNSNLRDVSVKQSQKNDPELQQENNLLSPENIRQQSNSYFSQITSPNVNKGKYQLKAKLGANAHTSSHNAAIKHLPYKIEPKLHIRVKSPERDTSNIPPRSREQNLSEITATHFDYSNVITKPSTSLLHNHPQDFKQKKIYLPNSNYLHSQHTHTSSSSHQYSVTANVTSASATAQKQKDRPTDKRIYTENRSVSTNVAPTLANKIQITQMIKHSNYAIANETKMDWPHQEQNHNNINNKTITTTTHHETHQNSKTQTKETYKQHHFINISSEGLLTWCDACAGLIWPLLNSSCAKCKYCNFIVHLRCLEVFMTGQSVLPSCKGRKKMDHLGSNGDSGSSGNSTEYGLNNQVPVTKKTLRFWEFLFPVSLASSFKKSAKQDSKETFFIRQPPTHQNRKTKTKNLHQRTDSKIRI